MRFEDLDLREVGHTIQIAGAIFNIKDGPSLFLPFPGEEVAAGGNSVLLMDSEQWQQFLFQSDILETSALVEDESGKIVKAIVRKSQRQVDQRVAWAVYRRDEFKCRYCGVEDMPLTVDHLVLWEDGGPSTKENLVAACKKCNRTRGNTPYSEWLHSPYYLKRSAKLNTRTVLANEELVGTLSSIPRGPVRSRR